MSKAILISIKPKWVAKILNGEKTIEIRKSIPKCNLPIDVYIYCTKDKKYADLINRGGFLTGMVVAKFALNKTKEIRFDNKEIQKQASLTEEELFDYLFIDEPYHEDMHKGYAWFIDNLEIFDKPKEIGEFKYYKKFSEMDYMLPIPRKETCERLVALTRAPESFCYIEID